MKYFLASTFLLLFVQLNYAQSDLPLIPTDSIINEAIALIDNGEFEESIERLKQVSSLAPQFPKAQYESAYACFKSDKFEKALEIINSISSESDLTKHFKFNQLRANVLDALQDTLGADRSYKDLVKKYPYKSYGYYDYGLFLMKNKKYDEAIEQLKKSIYLNPLHYKSHFLLGALAEENGYYSEGIISLITAMYLYPQHSLNQKALMNMNKYLVTEDADVAKLNLHGNAENPFVEGEKLLKSGFALSNDYDNETEFTDKFLNQIHLFWYALDKVKDTDSYYNEFYIPFWKSIKKDLDFNTLACILFYSLEDKSIQKEIKKESKNIDKTYDLLRERYQNLLSYHNKDLDGKSRKVFYNINKGQLTGVGPYDGEKIHGDWVYILPEDGVKSSSVSYDSSGKTNGIVDFYDIDGKVFKQLTFKDNKLNGWEIFYDTDGKEVSRFFYKDGNLENEGITNYQNGKPKCIKNFKNDKYEGLYHCYYPDGTKEIELNFKNDLAHGKKKYYNAVGTITQDVDLKDDEYHGVAKGFYDDGTPSYIENYDNGLLVGEQKYFFPDGKLKNVNIYNSKGKIQSSKQYNILGNLVGSDTYNSKGENHGDCFDYYNDGNVESITTYKNGGIKRYQSFNYKGDVIQEIKVNNKALNTYLNILGNPMAKGKKIKNKLQGEWLYYFPNGSIKRKSNYDNNAANHGEFIQYHHNGKISSIMYYVEGEAQGLYKGFYPNGILKTEGVYFNDKPIGEWRFYNLNETLYKKYFYNNEGQLIKHLVLNKKEEPHITYVSERNKVVKIIIHDQEDKIFDFEQLPKDNTLHFTKDAERYDFQIYNGVRHGKERYYNTLDETINEGEFVNSLHHGKRATYNVLGNLKAEANYIAGEEWGTSKIYNYLGVLQSSNEVKNGNTFGEYTVYYLNGNKRLQYTRQNDEMVSPINYYGSNGELLFTKFELNDQIYGYKVNGGEFKEASKGKAQVVASYKNGKKALEIDYNNGTIHGKYNFYYENGSPYIISTRSYGDDVGEYTQYYPNGQVFFKQSYELGEKHGPAEIFNENGDKIADLNYYYDYLDGEIKIYENKKLKYTKIYDLGNLLEIKVH